MHQKNKFLRIYKVYIASIVPNWMDSTGMEIANANPMPLFSCAGVVASPLSNVPTMASSTFVGSSLK